MSYSLAYLCIVIIILCIILLCKKPSNHKDILYAAQTLIPDLSQGKALGVNVIQKFANGSVYKGKKYIVLLDAVELSIISKKRSEEEKGNEVS